MRSKDEILALKMRALKPLFFETPVERKMKVFKFEVDWIAAETQEQAVLWYANNSDWTIEEAEEAFEGEIDLNDTMVDEAFGAITFHDMIETYSITETCVIATTEH